MTRRTQRDPAPRGFIVPLVTTVEGTLWGTGIPTQIADQSDQESRTAAIILDGWASTPAPPFRPRCLYEPSHHGHAASDEVARDQLAYSRATYTDWVWLVGLCHAASDRYILNFMEINR